MKATTPKRIEILPESTGEVVARHVELGRVVGEFIRVPTNEIYFHYVGDNRRWYVNKNMSLFCQAVAIFNRYCELHADDEDTDDPAVWATVAAQLRSELENIEPFGNSVSSLWGATIEDSEGGLLTLC